jgi:hypothetical protein
MLMISYPVFIYPDPAVVNYIIELYLYVAQVSNGILDDEDQGDVIGEYTPDVIVTEFVGVLPLSVTRMLLLTLFSLTGLIIRCR